MMLLLAATMGFYSCSSDDDDDNPVMELTSENITGSWHWETDDEYVEYYFDAFGNGSYYYESDKDYKSESYNFHYNIEDDKIVIVKSLDGTTYSYKIAELRKNSVIIEIEDRTFTFVREYDDDDYDDDDDDYDDGDDDDDDDDDYEDIENIPTDRPEPVPPTGDCTKIIGTWGNASLLGGMWDDDIREHPETSFTFNADGTGYVYDGEEPEDSYNFIYKYTSDNVLMIYISYNIRMKFTVTFNSVNTMRMQDDYFYDLNDGGYEYSNVVCSLSRQ